MCRPAAPLLSVVIPTRNRRERLTTALVSLSADADRPGSPPIEVIVVDDGSTDGTQQWVEKSRIPSAVSLIRLADHQGPARARNEGARAARGNLILFLADDLRMAPGLLAAHARAHADPSRTLAVVGEIRWDPELRITPFMRFLEQEGIHFDFAAIRAEAAKGEIPFWRAYASNLSLPRLDFLTLGGFDESFPEAAYEDLEFAYRFTRRGGRLAFEPRALAWHASPETIRSYLAWRRKANRYALAACKKAPPLAGRVLRPARGSGKPWRRLYANPVVAGSLAFAASHLDSSLGIALPRAIYRGLLSYALPRAPAGFPGSSGISLRAGLKAGASLIPARLLHERLAEAAEAVRGDVLDIGCGESPYRRLFEAGAIRRYVGVDIRPQPRSAGPMAVAAAEKLPFQAGSFDTVITVEVLEHCPDPHAVVGEAARCLRPGGNLILTVPFFYPPHDLPHDYFRFTKDGLERLVDRAGLALRSIHPIGGVGCVVADFVVKIVNDTCLAGGMALARAARLGPGACDTWARALGACLTRALGLAGIVFLASRSCLAGWIARNRVGWLRSRLDRFLADRSSRITKGYLAVAGKKDERV